MYQLLRYSYVTLFLCLLNIISPLQVAYAQKLVPIIGTDYYCIHYPDGRVGLGQVNGQDVQAVDFDKGIEAQRKKVMRSNRRIKALNKLLRDKDLNKTDIKSLKGTVKNLFSEKSGSSPSEIRKTKIQKAIQKERQMKKFHQSQLDKFFDCEEGKAIVSSGNVSLEFFSREVVDPGSRRTKIFSGYYISAPYPLKVKKNQKLLSYTYCTQYSASDGPVNAVGSLVPLESKVIFTNNLCGQSRAPFELLGTDCTGILPPKTVGVLLVDDYSNSGPSDQRLAFMFESVSNVSHYIRKVPKKGCAVR